MSRRSQRSASGQANREDALLAEVDLKIAEAVSKLEQGEMRQAVSILQRAYCQAEAFIRTSSRGRGTSQRPGSSKPSSAAAAQPLSTAAGKLACAMVRLQLGEVQSQLLQHQEALEEMRIAILETDEAWQAVLRTASPQLQARQLSEDSLPAAALSTLLNSPPAFLERIIEVSVVARCCAARELPAAGAASADKLFENLPELLDLPVSEATSVTPSAEEEHAKVGNLLQEAMMLARHLLPEGHPARRRAEESLALWQGSTEQEPDDAFMSEITAEEALSLERGVNGGEPEARASSAPLPRLSRLQSRSRLPPPATAPEARQRPLRSSSSWSGACSPGDVYTASFWGRGEGLPRLQPGRKKEKRSSAQGAENPEAAGKTPGEGAAAGSLPRPASGPVVIEERHPNPFEDFLQSSDDPTKFSIKRIALATEDGMRRLHVKMRDESFRFKYCYLKDKPEDQLYEERQFYSSWGLNASRIKERKLEQWKKSYGWPDAPPKEPVNRDLFKYYNVKFSGSEPDLGSWRRLLQESHRKEAEKDKKKVIKEKPRHSINAEMKEGWANAWAKKQDQDQSMYEYRGNAQSAFATKEHLEFGTSVSNTLVS